jgi:glutamine phosphoribosylpyrophosphate amidotransferase
MACRMFGYAGRSQDDLHALYSGFASACANDPTLEAVAPGCSRHCHGWGYVVHAENGLFHYRSSRPVYDDNAVLPKLEGEIRAIFHGRYASNEKLAGHIFAHPFVAATNDEIIFLAHNGGVLPENELERSVDSEWVLDEIARGGGTGKVLSKLKERTKSALNLLILKVGRGAGTPVSLQYFHFFKDPNKAAYYRMYAGAMPEGRALVSSTLTMNDAKVRGLTEIAPAEFDALASLDSVKRFPITPELSAAVSHSASA